MFPFRNKPVVAAFAIGTRVRVKAGTMDPDYHDMPLGGWVGTVTQVSRGTPDHYLVRWNQETLQRWNKFWRREIWLSEDKLESDPGGPVCIEQPPMGIIDVCCKMQHPLPQM